MDTKTKNGTKQGRALMQFVLPFLITHKIKNLRQTIPKDIGAPLPNGEATPRPAAEFILFCGLKFEPPTPAGIPREEAGAGAGAGAGADAGGSAARGAGVAFPLVIHAGSVADRPRPLPDIVQAKIVPGQ